MKIVRIRLSYTHKKERMKERMNEMKNENKQTAETKTWNFSCTSVWANIRDI